MDKTLPEKLLRFKFPILILVIASLSLGFFIYLAPSLVDVVKYFWPLLLSTALFLVAIVVFGQISPPHVEASGEKAGEGILDYVAGVPETSLQHPRLNEGFEAEEVASLRRRDHTQSAASAVAEAEEEPEAEEAAANAAKGKSQSSNDE